MSDDDDLDQDLDDLFGDADELSDDDVTAFERSSANYSGVTIGDEFQPVDEVELAEEGMELDDPERLAVLSDGADDPDGADAPPRDRLEADDLGWDAGDDA